MPGCGEASHMQPHLRLIPTAQLRMSDYMARTVSNAYRHSWRMHTQPHTCPHSAQTGRAGDKSSTHMRPLPHRGLLVTNAKCTDLLSEMT